ncbi:MAG: hypothetical protein JW910_04560 [Anaerolineae bacterium]|nr:hypothetical protein [Anaerolineae bacterium]
MTKRIHIAALVLGAASLVLLAVLAVGPAPAPAQAQEDDAVFTVGETTLESFYPRGMSFTVQADSSAGEITRATLFLVLRPGTRERFAAGYNTDLDAWVAEPYRLRGGPPPWLDFDYYWVFGDEADNSFETEAQYGVYADNTRTWYSIDTEDITLYWFGGLPELGEYVAQAMEVMREQYTIAWGRTISFKPLAVLFPPDRVWDEMVEGGNNPNAGGFTSPGDGYTVQRLPGEYTEAEFAELTARCGGMYNNGLATNPTEWRILREVHTILHEVTHQYQSDFRLNAPTWFTEGQADFFAGLSGFSSRGANGRLANYVSLGYDLPTLQGGGPGANVANPLEDGCVALGYNIGDSFLQWLTTTYGLETHLAVIQNMPGNGMEAALEIATGTSFLDLENRWRATFGLTPVSVLPTVTPFVLPTAPIPSVPTAPAG